MLEKWLEALEKEKQDSIDKLKKITLDRKIADVAIREIEINYTTVKNYLKEMDREGFRLNDDLSCIKEEYDANSNYAYRHFANHISSHLWTIRHMPAKVEDGTFSSEFSPYY